MYPTLAHQWLGQCSFNVVQFCVYADKSSQAVGRVRCHGAKGGRKDASWHGSLVQLNFESYTGLQKKTFLWFPDSSTLRKKEKKKKKTKRKRRKDTTSEESCLARGFWIFFPYIYIYIHTWLFMYTVHIYIYLYIYCMYIRSFWFDPVASPENAWCWGLHKT